MTDPVYASGTGRHKVYQGDCLDWLRSLPDACAHAVMTDPPYGLGFMGKKWDALPPGQDVFAELLRVCKPGAHLLSFGGSRTWHRMAVAAEDAGWEIRDTMMWVYGSGFPKSLNVSKAIDKAAGAERAVSANARMLTKCPYLRRGEPCRCADNEGDGRSTSGGTVHTLASVPATPEAHQWDGWGTALKPAWEPVTVARKPLAGTVAANVLEHGTGAMNVDGCRVGDNAGWSYPNGRGGRGWHGKESLSTNLTEPMSATQGRWPANLIHDGSDDVVGLFPQSSVTGNRRVKDRLQQNTVATPFTRGQTAPEYTDSGSAARFFYCAKASKAERAGVTHPTVKPLALMRYLVRLVTPPGGVVLDPFLGSGTTTLACEAEGMTCWGAEKAPEHWPMIAARWEHREAIIAQSDKRMMNHPALRERPHD